MPISHRLDFVNCSGAYLLPHEFPKLKSILRAKTAQETNMPRIRLCCLLQVVALTAAVTAAFSGCTGGGTAETLKVTGKITHNGQTVPGAMVTFSPTAPNGQAASGITNTQGEYTLTTYEAGDGARPGDYKVLVSKTLAAKGDVAKESTGSDPSAAYLAAEARGINISTGEVKPGSEAAIAQEAKDLLPAKYKLASSTDLGAKVEKGKDNNFNFDLKD
jgi:hypothetical protein